MTTLQKVIKYLAIAFAIFLIVSIVSGFVGVAGLIGGLFSEKAVTEELKTYPLSSEIRRLNLEINAADLCVKKGTSFTVESNLKNLKIKEKDGLLTISDNKKLNGDYNGAVLTIYVPADMLFHKVDLTMGAGKLTIENLSAETLGFELGAGDVTINTLTAMKSADIDGGAGRITIKGGTLNNLDLDMGVGQLNLTALLTGACEMDLGIGQTNLTLLGTQDDYRLDIEKGIGTVTVDGKKVSDFGSSGNGENRIEINGGIGAICVDFKKTGTK